MKSTGGIRVVQTGGFGGSGAVTADAQGRYGTMWRTSAAGKSVQVTARIQVTSTGDRTGAVVGLIPVAPPAEAGNPLTPAWPPTPELTGNYIAIRVVRPRGEKNADRAQLQLTYGHSFCGQSLPFRHPSGKLDLDTWYDVKLQVWPSEACSWRELGKDEAAGECGRRSKTFGPGSGMWSPTRVLTPHTLR